MTVEIINKAYKFRICPSKEQAHLLTQNIGCKRFVYNHFLNFRTDDTNKKIVLSMSTSKMVISLPELKKKYGFLNDAFSQSLQTSVRNLGKAFDDYFKGKSKFPTFQKRGRNDSITFPQKFRVNQQKNILFIPKVGEMSYKNSKQIKGIIKSMTVSKKCGKFYVSVLTEQTIEVKEKANINQIKNPVGIDVGLKEFATLSNGIGIENPRFYRKYEEKLAKEQRKLSKKEKFSSNWFKQLKKVQSVHHKIAKCRMDFLQKLSTDIVKNHDFVSVEDLAVSNMVRHSKLSKSIADAGWSMFTKMLEYKCKWQSKHFIKVERFYPSSKKCSNCGSEKLMPLKLRTYVCDNCTNIMDRDYNASVNIRNRGLELIGELQPI